MIKSMKFGALAVLVTTLLAQAPQGPPPVVSPEVHADRSVTFRLRAPNVKEVLLAREGAARVPMQRGEDGVWAITTPPLDPDIYGYSFIVDGVSMVDPMNASLKPNLLNLSNMVHVPGQGLPWEVANVPRGALHHHFYRSGIIGDDRDFYVYTPPGYDPVAKLRYPVLYLLHGFSDDASGWTAVGRAHVIFDNLIGQRKMQPMLVVMTLGYGAPEIVTRRGTAAFRDPALTQRNFDRYRDALFAEVIPAVEKAYRARSDRESRAIAGLSMGGATSLYVGLNALDRFAWIGAFSSGGLNGEKLPETFPALDAKANARLKLLWIGCGKEDFLWNFHGQLKAFLEGKGVKATIVETPGAHTWMVWRRYLSEFAPRLFQPQA
jgi:enterochelin esterase-like enzyme